MGVVYIRMEARGQERVQGFASVVDPRAKTKLCALDFRTFATESSRVL